MNTADQLDVYQENEELKEELQKLAAKVTRNTYNKKVDSRVSIQVEFFKIVGMMSANHHLKPGKNGYFTQPSISKPDPCSQGRQSLRMEKPSLPPPPPHRNTGCNNCYTLPSNDPRVR